MLLTAYLADRITPGLFQRIPGINCALLLSIRDSFMDSNIVDDAGYLLIINPKEDMSWENAPRAIIWLHILTQPDSDTTSR